MPRGRKSDAWIQQELQEARRCLNDGQALLNHASQGGALARTYFGLFHAAQAAVGMSKPRISNQHRNTEDELKQFVLPTEQIPFTHSDFELYTRLRQERGKVEYEMHPPEVSVDIQKMIHRIRNLVERLEDYAETRLYTRH